MTAKHLRIEGMIRQNILSGQWHGGDLIPSAKQLGEMHGTSALTARKAVETLVSKGVLVAKHGLGTFVSPRPALQHVGVVLGVGEDSNSQRVLEPGRYLRLIEAGCNEWAEKHLLKSHTYMYHSDEENLAPNSSFWRDVCEGRLDGLMLVGLPSKRLAKNLLLQRLTVVAIGMVPSSIPYRVQPDYRNLVFEAVGLMHQSSRSRLGFIGGITQAGDSLIKDERDYFAGACLEHGLPIDPFRIKLVHPQTPEEGFRCTQELLALPEVPDGLIIADDVLAQGACRALTQAAIKVPEEMSVVVHSNAGGTPISFPVPLTRLEFNPARMVEQAANMLTGMMRGEPPEECVVKCKPTLIKGESC